MDALVRMRNQFHYTNIMWSNLGGVALTSSFSNKMKLLLLSCIYLIYLQAVLARRSDDQTLNFLVLGDWGGQPDPPYTTEAETSIAAVMGSVAARENSQFTLALGDNFYDTGVKNVNDPRFNYTFEVGRELISSNNSPTLLFNFNFLSIF